MRLPRDLLGLKLQRHIDDHVFLGADVTGLTDPLQDGVRGHLVPFGRALRVQQERGVSQMISAEVTGAMAGAR